jgi:tripartite-type tricarboxylate transporter receptor subunit TctC
MRSNWQSAAFAFAFALVQAGATAAEAKDDATDFPAKNILLLVPFGAGGTPDVVARSVANELSIVLGKPIIVENRPGASTSLAATAVARAAPDGHTLMAVDISFAVTPHIAANLGVDPLKDFRPVGQTAKSVFMLIASSSLSTPTLPEFIALIKAKKEAVTIAHTGVGTTPHLAALTFMTSAGVAPLLVPFRGIADAVNNMLAGHISAGFSAANTGIAHVGSGRVYLLGVTGVKRMPVLPDVPTFAEHGIRMTGFENGSWYGIVAPAATPDPIVMKLHAAIEQVARNRDLQSKFASSGPELTSSTPKEFAAFITSQYDYWGQTLRNGGTTPKN